MGTTGLGCCIPPCFLVMLATDWERTLICLYGQGPWRVVEHVNDWCFRDIYKVVYGRMIYMSHSCEFKYRRNIDILCLYVSDASVNSTSCLQIQQMSILP